MSKRSISKWMTVAVLAVLTVLLFAPSGPLGKRIIEAYRPWAEERRQPAVKATAESMEAGLGTSAPVRTLGPADPVLYDSQDPKFGEPLEIGVLTGSTTLPRSRLVVGDKTDLYLVDYEAGETKTLGGAGAGPGEFGHVGAIFRTPEGMAVWDPTTRRTTSYSSSGELLGSTRHDPTLFRNRNAKPVAVFGDGAVLFRDDDQPSAVGQPAGARQPVGAWQPVGVRPDSARYVRVRDGVGEVFAEAAGDEVYYGAGPMDMGVISNRVLFGDRTYQASYGNGLLVVETGHSAIMVFDETGDVVQQRSTLPEKVPVSPDQMEAAREEMLAGHSRFFSLLPRGIAALSPGAADGSPTAQDISEAYAATPARSLAPALDTLFVDADQRLWLRFLRLPGAETVRWQVRDIEDDRVWFLVEHPGTDRVWDAQGDLVLTSSEDSLGVQRVRLRRLGPGAPAPYMK